MICSTAKKRGLGITGMYPSPINEIPRIAHRFAGLTFPAARLVADRLITLPCTATSGTGTGTRWPASLSRCSVPESKAEPSAWA
jgi:hypothetical protein